GSFKTRGAFAHLLTRAVPPAGVVAASGGNHGAAVAFAAMTLKVPAKIFVPTVSSPAKIARIRSYGADLVVGGDRYADALAASEAWAVESGALSVHAFDHEETIVGQGTVALELSEQASDLDTVLVAVRAGRQHRRRFARAIARRRADVSDRARERGARRAGQRRCDPACAADTVGGG